MERKRLGRPSDDTTQVFLFMGMGRAMRRMGRGIDEAVKGMSGSCDFMLSFYKNQPQLGARLAALLGCDTDAVVERLEAVGDTQEEPPPPVTPTGDIDAKTAATLNELGPTVSVAVKTAMTRARDDARADSREQFGLGEMVFHLLTQECEARRALMALSSAEAVDKAAEELRFAQGVQKDFMTEQKANTTELLESVWPMVQAQANRRSEAFLKTREELYAANPSEYETEVDLAAEFAKPAPDGQEYMARAGQCLHAAVNVARIRRAPEVRLDHMLYALLQPCTDTYAFLRRKGVDADAWRRALDSELPRYEDGPKWPENARDLGMRMPDATETKLLKDLPDDLDVSKLTKEEREEYIEIRPTTRRFTDLVWFRGILAETKSIGGGLFAKAGITEDELRAEVHGMEVGDPDWHKVKPNLIQTLQDAVAEPVFRWMTYGKALETAAQYEARRHNAPNLTFDYYLLAVLVDGTDTSALVDELGIDREAAVRKLDAALPTFASGPFYPERSTGVLFMELGREADSKLSDLQILVEAFDEDRPHPDGPPSAGVELLKAKGLSYDRIRQRLTELGLPPREYPKE